MTKIYELHESVLSRLIEQALFEDLGFGDATTEIIVPDERLTTAHFVAMEDGVIAGLEVAGLVFRYIDMQITFSSILREGDEIRKGQTIGHIHGPASGIIRGRQTAVNFLMRMSGIATLTRAYVKKVEGTHVSITGSRYTIPTLRMIDHFAVKAGGGIIHFFGSDEEIVITGAHAAVAGGFPAAIKKTFAYSDRERVSKPTSVEVTTFDELESVLPFADRLDRIVLNGFPPQVLPQAAEAVGGRTRIEVVGHITLDTVRDVAESGVHYIRIPELTHSSRSIPFDFRIAP
jgi:nicotinate-nucleotide pyrophosphorylase (carboxylating)